jgi:uncharacterized protein YecE (DUF72 family)
MGRGNATLRIGTSGYQYDHWQPVFYPAGMPKTKWLRHYADHFDTVEINHTFYNLPKAKTFDRWRQQTPRGFRYALKFSRYGTHMKKLKEPAETIGRFLDRAEHLKSYLGPILVQLPPKWRANPGRLEAFLKAAPRRHRWAVEFRDPDWLCDEIYEILRSHSAGLCVHDMIPDHPRRITTTWTYLRFHGNRYTGCYSPPVLSTWSDWMKDCLSQGADVYGYFNNDDKGYAVKNAMELRRYVLGEERG